MGQPMKSGNLPAEERAIALVTALLAIPEDPDQDSVRAWAGQHRAIQDDLAAGEVDAMAMLDTAVGFIVGTLQELGGLVGCPGWVQHGGPALAMPVWH